MRLTSLSPRTVRGILLGLAVGLIYLLAVLEMDKELSFDK